MRTMDNLARNNPSDGFEGRQYVFLHVPKTAGSSLRSILERQFPPEAIFPTAAMMRAHGGYVPIDKLMDVPQEEFDTYRLVMGHYGYQKVLGRFSRRPVWITMLRKPLDRCISECKHILRAKNHDMRRFLPSEGLTIRHILDSPEVRSYLSNLLRAMFLPALPDAKALLHQFEFVGIQERFADSMRLLQHTMGWPVTDIPQLNRAPDAQKDVDEAITPHDREELVKLLQWDIEFYEYACHVFDQRFQQAFGSADPKPATVATDVRHSGEVA